MKQTIFGATIIAIGLVLASVLAALVLKSSFTDIPRDALSKSIESLVEKDKNGVSKIESIGKEVAKSFTTGLVGGFSHMTDSQMTEAQRHKSEFIISEVKPVPSSWSQQEKVIGYVENRSDRNVSSISLQLLVKDSSGNLIDVETADGKIAGGIVAKNKVGFEIVHENKTTNAQNNQNPVNKNVYMVNVVDMKFMHDK
ncbi:MAG: hypothetical protein JF616_21590 [Fibrobacteres bacterium]|jgi:hypothetical protein|nr:hypothetical protein [Fibrobacterota bacterium]